MDLEGKMMSREVSQLLWESEKTVSTAESCTGGRRATASDAPQKEKTVSCKVIKYPKR